MHSIIQHLGTVLKGVQNELFFNFRNGYFDLVVIPTFDLIQSFHRLQIPIQGTSFNIVPVLNIVTNLY